MVRNPFARRMTRAATVLFMSGAGQGLAQAIDSTDAAVVLRSKDGTVEVAGKLVEFADDTYLIETTAMGLLRVSVSDVDCTGAACPAIKVWEPRFGIHGSRTIGTALIPNLLRGYAQAIGAGFELIESGDPDIRTARLTNPDGTLRVEVDLQSKGSGTAFPALADGTAAIGVADRRLDDGDLDPLAAGGVPDLRDTPQETVLGVDGLVVVVHKDNPVRNLSTLDLARIYSGEITNWQELGGGDVPITVHGWDRNSDSRRIFLDTIVIPNGRQEKADVVVNNSYSGLVDAVRADRGGIGYVGRSFATDIKHVEIREDCGLLSPPSDFRMKMEGYALSYRLYAYTRPDEIHPEARAFLDWVLTDAAQPVIADTGFVDRSLERMRLEDMGMALIHTAAVEPDFDGEQYSQMMRELRQADRLSVSFRFRFASDQLDDESARALEALALRIEAGEFDGHEVLLVGFADAIGARSRNTNLAQRRAEAVREILASSLKPQTLESLKLIPLSFGELLPLSCNDSDLGRERNRRVEVWIRLPGTRSNLR